MEVGIPDSSSRSFLGQQKGGLRPPLKIHYPVFLFSYWAVPGRKR